MSTERQRKQDEKRAAEQRLGRAMALKIAEAYCMEHGYSMEKVREQRFFLMYDEAIFAQPRGVEPDGLTNDMDTMPLPTLIITVDKGELVVRTTEHTDKYLMDDV